MMPNPQHKLTNVEVGGVTPFWIAAVSGDIEAMRVLVENGADPRLKSIEDTTPLIVAAGLGKSTRGPSNAIGRIADFDAEGVRVLKLLLEWGNDINAVNQHGQTALHGAAFAASHVFVQFLVENGARLDLKDATGRRPLEVADDNRRDEYRPTIQNYKPGDVERTLALLHKLSTQ